MIVGSCPSHGDEGAALSRHARGLGAELGEEELPQSSRVGRTPRKPSHKATKADSSTTVLGVRWCGWRP